MMMLSQDRIIIIFTVKFEVNNIAFTLKDSLGGQSNWKMKMMKKDEEGKFYQKLYSNPPYNNIQEIDENINFFLKNKSIPKLPTEENECCEDLLTEKKFLKAVKVMKNGKSPGTDGLTAEFYKKIWSDIKTLLFNSLNFSLSNGKLFLNKGGEFCPSSRKKTKIACI